MSRELGKVAQIGAKPLGQANAVTLFRVFIASARCRSSVDLETR